MFSIIKENEFILLNDRRRSIIMQKKKIILEIIEKVVEKYGFVYDEKYGDNLAWVFTREQDSIQQRIHIVEHRFAKELFLRFETTAWVWGNSSVDARFCIPENQYNNYKRRRMWLYENEESFRKALKEFAEIIEKYGIDKLNEISTEEAIIPTNEMGKRLLESHEILSASFIDKYQLEIERRTTDEIMRWFEIIENIINQTKDQPYENVKEDLIEIVAFLGEQLRKEVGGEWECLGEFRKLFLDKLNCYSMPVYSILRKVIGAWKDQNIEQLKQEYLFLLDAKLPLEIEEMERLSIRWAKLSGVL